MDDDDDKNDAEYVKTLTPTTQAFDCWDSMCIYMMTIGKSVNVWKVNWARAKTGQSVVMVSEEYASNQCLLLWACSVDA
jgi:hypothetical protein